jgi:PAS domain-containing protein
VPASRRRRAAAHVLIEEVAAPTGLEPSATTAGDDRPESIRFCSRCAHATDQPRGHLQVPRRICERCESGVLLTCRREALATDAFVIFGPELEVTAVSEPAESIFGPEHELIGQRLLELVSCPLGDEQLARHGALAAQRPTEEVALPLRVRSERGQSVGTLSARLATCGPPRAGLLTVALSPFGRR